MTSPSRIFQLSILAISLLALGLGVFFFIKTFSLSPTSSIIESASRDESKLEFSSTPPQNVFIVAEISGAVNFPSVYQLPVGSRVADFLREAGGLAENADKRWVERNINLASKVEDGSKIYFPRVGEDLPQVAGTETDQPSQQSAKVNINKAALSELETLWGIGAKRAEAIIAGRPYGKIEDLLERKIVPTNVFEAIKDKISTN